MLPDEFSGNKKKIFEKCGKLKVIKYSSGAVEKLRTEKEIKYGQTQILKSDFENCENVEKLSIAITVQFIEENALAKLNEIIEYKGDPKWLKCMPKGNIKKITIPSEIKTIDVNDFEECISLNEIIYEEKIFILN